MSSVTFEAWGTYVFLATRRPADLSRARDLAVGVLADVDRACSRFRAHSDLCRANAAAGRWVRVDPVLVAAVSAACGAAARTDGLVNPLLGRRLEQLGYDRDFALLTACADEVLTLPTDILDPAAWRGIGLDPDGAVRVPAGTALDLGATAKAWAADAIAAAFAAELSGSALVSLGGDIAIATPDPDPWPITISTRRDGPVETTVGLDRGGLATSSTQVRRWSRAGVRLHHVLDPRTGLPAAGTWRTVTATGPTCAAANTATTAAIVLGADAPAWLDRHRVTARLTAADGSVHTTGDWPLDHARDHAGINAERRGA